MALFFDTKHAQNYLQYLLVEKIKQIKHSILLRNIYIGTDPKFTWPRNVWIWYSITRFCILSVFPFVFIIHFCESARKQGILSRCRRRHHAKELAATMLINTLLRLQKFPIVQSKQVISTHFLKQTIRVWVAYSLNFLPEASFVSRVLFKQHSDYDMYK